MAYISLTVTYKNGVAVTTQTKSFNTDWIVDYKTNSLTGTGVTGTTIVTYREYGDGLPPSIYWVSQTATAITLLMAGGTAWQYTTVALTLAQLTTGFSVPVVALTTPGAGYINVVDPYQCIVEYTYGAAAYTGNLDLLIADTTGTLATATNAISGSASKLTGFVGTAGARTTAGVLYAKIGTGNPTVGSATGTVLVRIAYRPMAVTL